MPKDVTAPNIARCRMTKPVMMTVLCAGIALTASASAFAAPSVRATVPDAADYMPDVSASHVMNVRDNNCLPLERDPSSMPAVGLIYPDRRGFSTTGMFSVPDAWSRPISIGGLSAAPDSGGLALQMHDALGNPSQVPLVSLRAESLGSLLARPSNTSNNGLIGDNRISSDTMILPKLSEATSKTPSPAPSAPSRLDRVTSRLSKIAHTVVELQQRLTFSTAEKDASAAGHGMNLTCAVAQPGQTEWMDAGVLGIGGSSGALGGMKLTAQYLPIVSEGIGQRLAFSWGARNTNATGTLRLTGGRVAGEMFRETTITQRLGTRWPGRTVVGVTNFQLAGQRWNEAVMTSAFPMGTNGEFGVGLAVQQTGMGPFVSMARPFARGGQFSIALGAPSSIASRAPISLQLACPF